MPRKKKADKAIKKIATYGLLALAAMKLLKKKEVTETPKKGIGKTIALKDDSGRPYLIIIGEEPKSAKGKSEYKKDGFYISPQLGFYGLVTAYFKDMNTLKKNIEKKYHKQLSL